MLQAIGNLIFIDQVNNEYPCFAIVIYKAVQVDTSIICSITCIHIKGFGQRKSSCTNPSIYQSFYSKTWVTRNTFAISKVNFV